MKSIGVLLIGVALGMSAGACATAQARPATAVPLKVPEPPPRAAIDPVQLPEPAPSERPVSRPADTATGRQARPPAATSTPAPAVALPAATAPAAPAAELRPTGSSSPSISANELRQLIARTSKKLDALDRRRLSAGKQADYDTARRFLSQAQDAIKANNVMLAQYSADKAEALADGLR